MSDAGPTRGGHERDLRPEEPPRWGLGDAAVGFLVGLVLSNLLAGIWLSASGEDDLSLGGLGFTQLGLWIGLVGACLYASHRKGSGRLAVDFGLAFRPVDAALGLAGGVVAQFVLLPVVALLLRPLVGDPDVSGPARELADKAQGLGIVGLVVAVVIITPIVEELFFRGLLLRGFQRRFGDAWGVAVSSVLFGVSHLLAVPARALVLVWVSLTLFGALLAVLTIRTGRLGPAAVAHAIFNGWTLLVVLAIDP